MYNSGHLFNVCVCVCVCVFVCRLQLVNQGAVKLEYSWQVVMDLISNTSNEQEGVTTTS